MSPLIYVYLYMYDYTLYTIFVIRAVFAQQQALARATGEPAGAR